MQVVKNIRILEITCSLVTFVISALNRLTCRSFVMQSCSLLLSIIFVIEFCMSKTVLLRFFVDSIPVFYLLSLPNINISSML